MRVLRWGIAVDGADHFIYCGRITHVDCRRPDVVEFWAVDVNSKPRTFRAFATGEVFPDGPAWRVIGTVLSPALPPFTSRGDLVWHLAERVAS